MRGAVIKCPNCGAVVNQPGNILRCEYCGTQVRVQRRTGFFERVEPPRNLPPQMLNLPVVIQAHSKKWMTFATIIPLVMFIGIGSSVFFAIKKQKARTDAATAPLRSPTWNGITLPAARDVNGDGVLDAVGRARVLQPKHIIHVAAYSGTDGKRLWLSEVLGAYDDFESSGVTDEFFLIAKKSGEVTAIRLANGKTAWTARFAERVENFCADNEANIGVLLADKTRSKLAKVDGKVATADGKCMPLETDISHKRGRNREVRDTNRGGEGPPKRSAFEGMAVGGALYGEGAVRIAHGDKSPGTRTPMLARYTKPSPPDDLGDLATVRLMAQEASGRERSRLWSKAREIENTLSKLEAELVWKVLVPGVDPLSVKGHDPDSGHVSIGPTLVATVYETRDKAKPWRVTAFSLDGGKRLFDSQVPGDRPMSGVTVAGDLVFVSTWSALYAYRVADGELVWTLRQ